MIDTCEICNGPKPPCVVTTFKGMKAIGCVTFPPNQNPIMFNPADFTFRDLGGNEAILARRKTLK